MDIETWRDIPGYEGLYQASDAGNIRRVIVKTKISLTDIPNIVEMRESGMFFRDIAQKFGVTHRAIIKALTSTPSGRSLRQPYRIIRQQHRTVKGRAYYPSVRISKNGECKTWQVYKLVAITFLGIPDGQLDVNHKNGIKTDSRLQNLEYVTRSENCKHSFHVLGNNQHLRNRPTKQH